jgi:tetrapyrrole methylase family protein/MazG family protein
VVGLGPAGPALLTVAALDAIERIPVRILRTFRHPSASAVDEATSCDDLYEQAESMGEVYAGIVERLVTAAEEHGEVIYAVPGSPWVAEASVGLLVDDPRVEVEVLPGLSFLDLVWDRLRVDPLAAGVRLVDGRRFAVEAAGQRGPLVVAQCDSAAVLSEVKLAVDDEGPPSVVVLQRLGLPDESTVELEWADLDRAVEPDHLTALWIPSLAAPVGTELVRFAELVRTLRSRCPWDREQTHASLTRYLLEETYELLEAIEALQGVGDDSDACDQLDGAYEHLEEELGDVLFQVFFHATLAAEAGRFDVAGVARTVHDKLVRRHPHVFAGLEVAGTDDIVRNWDRIKAEEKGRSGGPMDGVPPNLPALLYAHKIQRRAAAVGVEVDVPATTADMTTADMTTADMTTADEVGTALFSLVATSRRLGVDPEGALRAVATRFRDDVAAGMRVDVAPE